MHALIRLCALLLLMAGAQAAQGAESLVIGRSNENSVVYDISERVVNEVFRRAGIPLQIKRLPSLRVLESANDGEIDGDLHRIADVKRLFPDLLLVPTAINRIDVAVWSADPGLATKSRTEVMRMTVAYPRGRLVLQKFAQGLAATETTTRMAAAEMAVMGRVDLMMGVYSDVQSDIAAGRLAGLHVWPHLFGSERLYLVLHPRHVALVPRLDAVVQRMKQEGLLDKYYVDGLRSAGVLPLDP